MNDLGVHKVLSESTCSARENTGKDAVKKLKMAGLEIRALTRTLLTTRYDPGATGPVGSFYPTQRLRKGRTELRTDIRRADKIELNKLHNDSHNTFGVRILRTKKIGNTS